MKNNTNFWENYFTLIILSLIVILGINTSNSSLRSNITIPGLNNKVPLDDTLITVLSPNGGEIWEPGTTEFIKWNSLNVTNLKIEYSTNDGSDWNIVNANVLSSIDSTNWIIPNTPSQQCLIKISNVNNNTIADTSNTVFMISSIF